MLGQKIIVIAMQSFSYSHFKDLCDVFTCEAKLRMRAYRAGLVRDFHVVKHQLNLDTLLICM